MKELFFLFMFGVFLMDAIFATPIQCKDEDDNPVDWYVAYKLPQIKRSHDQNVKDGIGFVYVTSRNLSIGWTLSKYSCNDSRSIMGNTLKVLYTQQMTNLTRILYNDEPPNGEKSDTFGHTKGVVLGNDKGGLWLIHSVPHFPPISASQYSYPHTGIRYGQSFLCISLPFAQMDTLGTQLKYNEPTIYDMEIPPEIQAALPELTMAAKGRHILSPPWFNTAHLTTINGETFVSYAKSMHFGKDLYADWVAIDLKTDLIVETWSNGAGRMPSECSKPFKVENAEIIHVIGTNFSTHQDHSKWAVAHTERKPWVCVGDINRMIHQEQRGGGTVCILNNSLWQSYRKTVASMDVCPLSQDQNRTAQNLNNIESK